MTKTARHALIIGAGVIGLQTALTLLEHGYKVTIVAQHIPGDESIAYTSPWAGAQWRSHAAINDLRQQQWDAETYAAWLEVIRREKGQGDGQSGLKLYPSTLIYNDAGHADFTGATEKNPGAGFWFRNVVAHFAETSPPAGLEGPVHKAFEYACIFIDVPVYLRWLHQEIVRKGGVLIRANLPTEQGFGHALGSAGQVAAGAGRGWVDFYVNASGIGARTLVGDQAVHPVRGQVVIVQGVADRGRSRQGVDEQGKPYMSYVIPRPYSNSTILGGTREVGNWSDQPSEEVTKRILASCKSLAPELLGGGGQFRVQRVVVGLRPARLGGARVEAEWIYGKTFCVHAYGVGGAGYQNSIGVANEVHSLAHRHLTRL